MLVSRLMEVGNLIKLRTLHIVVHKGNSRTNEQYQCFSRTRVYIEILRPHSHNRIFIFMT